MQNCLPWCSRSMRIAGWSATLPLPSSSWQRMPLTAASVSSPFNVSCRQAPLKLFRSLLEDREQPLFFLQLSTLVRLACRRP